MKWRTILSKVLSVIANVAVALLLLIFGVIIVLYSPWAQRLVKDAIVKKFDGSNGDVAISIETFRLRFPLKLDAGGLVVSVAGDTMVTARDADIDVALLPLFIGEAKIRKASLTGVRYNQGTPDSIMYMTLAADSVGLSPTAVRLSNMAIKVDEGAIKGGRMAIYMKPDTTPPTPPSPPMEMSVSLGRISLDDFTFMMQMMPTIDTLSAHIATSVLTGGEIDMYKQTVSLGTLIGSGLDARYIAPDSTSIANGGPYLEETPADATTEAAMPWTVEIDSLAFSNSHALYTTAGVIPAPGLDFNYIELDSLDLRIHDLYNQATIVRLPLSVWGKERCGVSLAFDGVVAMENDALRIDGARLSTKSTTGVAFDALFGLGDMATDMSLPLKLRLDGALATDDLKKMFPEYAPYLASIPRPDDLLLDIDLHGTTGHLDIDELSLRLNRCLSLSASGSVDNFMNFDAMSGALALKGNIINVDAFKKQFLEASTAESINIPPMSLNGNVAINKGVIAGNLKAITGAGDVKFDGRWDGNGENYAAEIITEAFPINAFMPDLGVGDITMAMAAEGHGYDPYKPATRIEADFEIQSVAYQDVRYTDIKVTASLTDCKASARIESENSALDFTLNINGTLDEKESTWTAVVDGRYIDLFALKFVEEPSSIEITAKAQATLGPGASDIKAQVNVDDMFYTSADGTISLYDLDAKYVGNDSLTSLAVVNRDLSATFSSTSSLDSLISRFSLAADIISDQMRTYMLDVDTLSKAMPEFVFDIKGGNSNLVNDILATSGMSVRKFSLSVDNDSILSMNGFAHRFDTGSIRLDTLTIGARQHRDNLMLRAGLRNRPGNLEEWHKVDMFAYADSNVVNLRMHQEDIKGEVGFKMGLFAQALPKDSTLVLSIKPYDPIIGYQKWSVNDDNFISYHIPNQHIDANLHMNGAGSSLAVYTEHQWPEEDDDDDDDDDGHEHEHGHKHVHTAQEDLIIQLKDIHVSDWISFNPFAPPIKGDINADIHLNRKNEAYVGQGDIGITNFTFGRRQVSDFRAAFDLSADTDGTIFANADLFVDGEKTMSLTGALNDSTSTTPLNLDFSMIRFPLATVNPFMPAGTGTLSGVLNGNMKISGTDQHPIINGSLEFDSTAVFFALTGTSYAFSQQPVTVVNSVVDFNNFTISGCNNNPLYVNGLVDVSDMNNIRLSLDMKANNMQIVNTTRPTRGADVYGKGFVSLNAKAHGTLNRLNVEADLRVLSGTNITYVIPEATNMLASKANDDMVKFVNFTDSLEVVQADDMEQTMAMFLDAALTIQNGSTINVDLSADGKNRVQLQSNGTLNYAMTPLDDGRLTGRLNLDKGFVRYTPPFMSEKYFTFEAGSYVSFTGDMFNPTLNLRATDVIKANVTQTGQNSRLVNFDVSLAVTGTLNQMDVAFDLATNDDITVANELESMSREQRANQAMNMLLYNVYTGPGTKGNASLSGNPLFSFLESQINSWAANNIRGVDLSFGINQYDRTVDGSKSSTMSYSYQVSKSLFNDRFKIVVGGNYSTDANADENFSQNLISDISFEYYLNSQKNMYLRLFRHTGYESILEGEVTQTGVGFVYKRKLSRVGDMFLSPKQARRRTQARVKREIEKYNESLNKKAEQQ
ncbi:MAG: translocation/assembly module TamB domain-containing protein [Muribaculaceae bacterium]|nr:translocation/assembly module TamB domain-containing protein [Muribaculaceae bacterium]